MTPVLHTVISALALLLMEMQAASEIGPESFEASLSALLITVNVVTLLTVLFAQGDVTSMISSIRRAGSRSAPTVTQVVPQLLDGEGSGDSGAGGNDGGEQEETGNGGDHGGGDGEEGVEEEKGNRGDGELEARVRALTEELQEKNQQLEELRNPPRQATRTRFGPSSRRVINFFAYPDQDDDVESSQPRQSAPQGPIPAVTNNGLGQPGRVRPHFGRKFSNAADALAAAAHSFRRQGPARGTDVGANAQNQDQQAHVFVPMDPGDVDE